MSDEPPVRPKQSPVQRVPGSFSCRLEWPEHEVTCSPPPSGHVNNDFSYTSASPCAETHVALPLIS